MIWVTEILLGVVLLFTLWGAIKGAYVVLLVTALVAFFMYRQWHILQSIGVEDDDDEEDDDEDDEE
jgi:hypothetical protein